MGRASLLECNEGSVISRCHCLVMVITFVGTMGCTGYGDYDSGANVDIDAGVKADDPMKDAGPNMTVEPPEDICSRCHGGPQSPAPPRSLDGATSSADMRVGAHQSHLVNTEGTTFHAPVLCSSCHRVPETVSAPGHIDDSDNRAELTFGGVAIAGGATPEHNRDTGTCSNVYCHGATLSGGTRTQPVWNQIDGVQRQCTTCHGAPPPAPHPAREDCSSCHPTVSAEDNRTFLDPTLHINGILEVEVTAEEQPCDSCHGSNGDPAPPVDLSGNSDRSFLGVGAHQAHLDGDTSWRREINCSNCHVVPLTVNALGHLDGDNIVEVPFDDLNPEGTVDLPTGTCDNLYCHGNGQGNNGAMQWLDVVPLGCNSCHRTPEPGENAGPMSGAHDEHIREQRIQCMECHEEVIDRRERIITPALHVNGQRNVQFEQGGRWQPQNKRCTNLACHGDESW